MCRLASLTVSLLDCLHGFCAEDELTGNDKYQCEYCKTHNDATKVFTIVKPPEVVILSYFSLVISSVLQSKKHSSPTSYSLLSETKSFFVLDIIIEVLSLSTIRYCVCTSKDSVMIHISIPSCRTQSLFHFEISILPLFVFHFPMSPPKLSIRNKEQFLIHLLKTQFMT